MPNSDETRRSEGTPHRPRPDYVIVPVHRSGIRQAEIVPGTTVAAPAAPDNEHVGGNQPVPGKLRAPVNFVRDDSATDGYLAGAQAYLDETKKWESSTFIEAVRSEIGKARSSKENVDRLAARAAMVRSDPYGVAVYGAREDREGEQARQRDQERATRFYPDRPDISGLPARRYELSEASRILSSARSLLEASFRDDLRGVRNTVKAQQQLIKLEQEQLNPRLNPLMERQRAGAFVSTGARPPTYDEVTLPTYDDAVGRPDYMAGSRQAELARPPSPLELGQRGGPGKHEDHER